VNSRSRRRHNCTATAPSVLPARTPRWSKFSRIQRSHSEDSEEGSMMSGGGATMGTPQPNRFTRRTLLQYGGRTIGALAGLALLDACGGSKTTGGSQPSPSAVPSPTSAPSPTVPSTPAPARVTATAASTSPRTVDLSQWSPDYVKQIAGTLTTVDTKATVAKVVPLETSGQLLYWYIGPTDTTPQMDFCSILV